ncbi:MAG: response regulator [Gemmataceae bacterium]|nr:response regulator [Gemmataceae bacterium]
MIQKALVVEDEEDTGQILADTLRHWGFETTLLTAGNPVVPWVRKHYPDLVLLDVMLPDTDGYAICERLKLDRTTNLIPIVMVTARSAYEDKVRGLQVGANHYLTKPFTLKELQQAVVDLATFREDLARSGTHGEIHFWAVNDVQCLHGLNRLLASLFLFTPLPPAQVGALIRVVRELGDYAIEWGHRKQLERIVDVTYRIERDHVTILMRDSGPGFEPKNLPHTVQEEDPVGYMKVREPLGLREGGFGILLARAIVDEVQCNEQGNELRFVKRFLPLEENAVAP